MPAGLITASLSPTGLLTITGDDDANEVTIAITGAAVTLTPDVGTKINLKPTGMAETFTGPVTSIKADLKGGADIVRIDGLLPFVVSGAVFFNLGDGNNTLDLTTAGLIELGSLTVKAGDGSDTVTIDGGAGSQVFRAAS